MSQLVARILLTIFLFPLAALIYIATFAFTQQSDYRSRTFPWILAGAIAWAFIVTYWWLLWRRFVKQTAERRICTMGVGVGACIIGVVIGALGSNIDSEFGAFLGSVSAPILWLVGTVFIWQETDAERKARLRNTNNDAIVCPTCGYNLTGLKEPRCPECGTQFTLDQLLTSQPSRIQAELTD
jgi:uncharacterized paraquat-inducible protein A